MRARRIQAGDCRGYMALGLILVLVLLTVLAGAGVYSLRYFSQADQSSSTAKYIDEARRSLFIRAQVKGTLPFAEGGSLGGGLPYAELGVRPSDEWGRQLKYQVSSGLVGTRYQSCQNLKTGTGVADIRLWDSRLGVEVSAAAVILSGGPADADGQKDVFDIYVEGVGAPVTRGDNTAGTPYALAPPNDSFDDQAQYVTAAVLASYLRNSNIVNNIEFNWTRCDTAHCVNAFWDAVVEDGVDCGGNDCPPCSP